MTLVVRRRCNEMHDIFACCGDGSDGMGVAPRPGVLHDDASVAHLIATTKRRGVVMLVKWRVA
jgi:hypothetical protein